MKMTQYRLIYDDRCGLCRAWVRWVKERDEGNRIQPEPCREGNCDEVRFVSPEGNVYGGSSAIPVILSLFPSYRFLGIILKFKFMQFPLLWGYKTLARNRYFLTKVLGSWSD